MGRPRLFNADDALDAAMRLFWAQGYGQTSIAHLVAATGASRASLYAEFGDKRALFERTVAHYTEQIIKPLVAGMQAPGAGLQSVRDYLQRLLASSGTPESEWGCLACTTVADLAPNDADADRLAAQALQPLRDGLKNALDNAARTGELGGRDPEGLAVWIYSTVVGTAVLARAPSGRAFAEATLNAMLADLE